MSTKRNLAAGVATVGLAFGLPAGAQAQQKSEQDPSSQVVLNPSEVLEGASIRLTVNGMVCPFCAYGLEQRLGDLAGVDDVLVQVSDGLVQIRTIEGQELTDEALKDTVKKAGFSLTAIERLGA